MSLAGKPARLQSLIVEQRKRSTISYLDQKFRQSQQAELAEICGPEGNRTPYLLYAIETSYRWTTGP